MCRFRVLAVLFLLGFGLTRPALANDEPSQIPKGSGVYIKVGEAKAQKSLVAFPALQFLGAPASVPQYQTIGAELYKVVMNNLTSIGYFQFIAASAFLEDPATTGLRPFPQEKNGFKFESWKQIGAEFLLRASYSVSGESLTLETYAYHVSKGELILGKRYKGTLSSIRRVAHTFSSDLLEALTGQRGPFLSKIVVASDRAGGNNKEIYVMDWDSTNPEKITNHKSITLSPAWSHDGKKVAYTAFVMRAKSKIRNADLFTFDLTNGKRWLTSYKSGINSGASFSPDGKHLYLTISSGGTPNIFKTTIEGEVVKQITNGPAGAMNVEPSVSPDGNKIAFTSDRAGRTMIYIMNADGSNPVRRTFAGQFNASPAWSPDGKQIAFAGWLDDHFDIFTMNADGTGMLRITQAKRANGKWARNEDPCYSPDGRLLMYTSDRTGSNQIYISNLDGSEERRLTSDSFNYYKPKWSVNQE